MTNNPTPWQRWRAGGFDPPVVIRPSWPSLAAACLGLPALTLLLLWGQPADRISLGLAMVLAAINLAIILLTLREWARGRLVLRAEGVVMLGLKGPVAWSDIAALRRTRRLGLPFLELEIARPERYMRPWHRLLLPRAGANRLARFGNRGLARVSLDELAEMLEAGRGA